MPDSTSDFLDSVLRLKPLVAAFDCDGTLWSGDAGERFFDWEMKKGLVSAEVATSMRARYAGYKAGTVSEDDMCGEMVSMHNGLRESTLMNAADEFFNHAFPSHIFPEMRELVQRLQKAGCEVWAVSSSNEWVIRAGMKHFGIPENRILATAIEIREGIITNRLIRIPSGAGKPKALREVVKKDVDAAFGNSRWDAEMLAMSKHAFAVNPNPDLEATARLRSWTIYFPNGTQSRA
ncbi:MAG: HAD-IB family phosphatase [Candidatus Sulfotelmatobacter sp.]|jgi:HAD superfamily phosphoserine phosphatase-like hydrolase